MPPFPYKKLRNESSRQVGLQCAAGFLRETSQKRKPPIKRKGPRFDTLVGRSVEKVKAMCRDDLTQKERYLVRQACDFSKNGFEPVLLQAVCKNSRSLTQVHLHASMAARIQPSETCTGVPNRQPLP